MSRKNTVSFAAVEELRLQLKMRKGEFCEALGYDASTYSGWEKTGVAPAVALVAARWVASQSTAPEPDRYVVLHRNGDGFKLIYDGDAAQTMTLDGRSYLLLPVTESGRG